MSWTWGSPWTSDRQLFNTVCSITGWVRALCRWTDVTFRNVEERPLCCHASMTLDPPTCQYTIIAMLSSDSLIKNTRAGCSEQEGRDGGLICTFDTQSLLKGHQSTGVKAGDVKPERGVGLMSQSQYISCLSISPPHLDWKRRATRRQTTENDVWKWNKNKNERKRVNESRRWGEESNNERGNFKIMGQKEKKREIALMYLAMNFSQERWQTKSQVRWDCGDKRRATEKVTELMEEGGAALRASSLCLHTINAHILHTGQDRAPGDDTGQRGRESTQVNNADPFWRICLWLKMLTYLMTTQDTASVTVI